MQRKHSDATMYQQNKRKVNQTTETQQSTDKRKDATTIDPSIEQSTNGRKSRQERRCNQSMNKTLEDHNNMVDNNQPSVGDKTIGVRGQPLTFDRCLD